jgi:hypothetical protein
MFFRSYTPIIDEKLKNYIKQLNDSYMDRYKIQKKTLFIDSFNKDNNDIVLHTNTNTNTNKSFYILLAFSFFTGYQFRSLVDYYK